MSATSLRAKAASARLLLAAQDAGGPLDQSEDELQTDAEPTWTWLYNQDDAPERAQDVTASENDRADRESASPTIAAGRPRRPGTGIVGRGPSIVGAQLGDFVIRVGSAVTLRADRNDVWVAIVTKFLDSSSPSDELSDEDESESNDEDAPKQKRALFTWLSSPREIRNPRHRRADCLPNELYATGSRDVNPLEAILGNAAIVSPQEYFSKYPNGKIPKSSPDFGKLFICRRGANLRTATYTDEFKWGVDFMQGVDGAREVEELWAKVESETQATRKRKPGADIQEGLKDFVVPDGDEAEAPKTPHKRRKADEDGAIHTPHSRAPKALTPRKTPASASKFTTPTHRRIVEKKPLTFTPLGTRILSSALTPHLDTPHAVARTKLHVASVPASLPCREAEFSIVYTHLESAITSSTGTCIYISGTPGTGKTATVREVVAQLHASVQAEELDDFVFVEINGMRLVDPHQAYSLLWEALTSSRVAPAHALSLLTQEFSRPSPRRVPVVVLMDELDQLVTRSQGVMYNFFQWPGLRHSRLIVLAVANTMDLPERTLSNKISSRLGLTRIVFQGYTHTQLMRIVETRLAAVPGVVVEEEAIQFAARKVAGVSGDARRCLDICRRAVEMAEADIVDAADAETGADDVLAPKTPTKLKPKPNTTTSLTSRSPSNVSTGRVTIPHIQRAIREATSSPLAQYLRGLPAASKLFIAALLALSRRSGVSEALVGDCFDEAGRLCRMESAGLEWRVWLLGQEASLDEDDNMAINDDGGMAFIQKTTPKKRGKSRAKIKDSTTAVQPAARVLGMSDALEELMSSGVLAVEEGKGERGARCRILVGEEEVKGALRGDEEVKGLGFDA